MIFINIIIMNFCLISRISLYKIINFFLINLGLNLFYFIFLLFYLFLLNQILIRFLTNYFNITFGNITFFGIKTPIF